MAGTGPEHSAGKTFGSAFCEYRTGFGSLSLRSPSLPEAPEGKKISPEKKSVIVETEATFLQTKYFGDKGIVLITVKIRG